MSSVAATAAEGFAGSSVQRPVGAAGEEWVDETEDVGPEEIPDEETPEWVEGETIPERVPEGPPKQRPPVVPPGPGPRPTPTSPPDPIRPIWGNSSGGDVSDPTTHEPPDEAVQAKVAEALDNYVPSPEDDITEADFRKVASRFGLSGTEVRPLDSSEQSPAKKLKLKHYGQKTGYYCGPASGYMMLRYMKAGRSKYNNAKLSQSNLAKSAHMNTNDVGATTWVSKRFIKGLNRWRGNSYFVQVNTPPLILVKAALTVSISTHEVPIAADTVELAGGPHYNNHPRNKTIGHWVVGYGYEEYGVKGFWADPATTVFPGARAKFAYRTKSFTGRFLQHNGIVF